MRLTTLNLPEHMIKKLNEAVKKGYAECRATAIRDAIRDYLILHNLWGHVETSAKRMGRVEVSSKLMEAILNAKE